MTFRMIMGMDQRARILSRAKKDGWVPNGKGAFQRVNEIWPLEDILLFYS